MSSSNASFDSSSDPETAETELEYDLKVEVMSNASEQKDTSDNDEPEDVYTNEPLADENWLSQYALLRVISPLKRNWVKGYALFLFGVLLHPKTTHLSGIFFLSTEAKIVPN